MSELTPSLICALSEPEAGSADGDRDRCHRTSTPGAAVEAAYRDVIGRHYPTMSAVQVAASMEDRARVEIEATAVVPV